MKAHSEGYHHHISVTLYEHEVEEARRQSLSDQRSMMGRQETERNALIVDTVNQQPPPPHPGTRRRSSPELLPGKLPNCRCDTC
ncbi:unnamed protein product [Gongylonema pulchrum]|uniref:Uncharacterized protein n=1 Tax=Gongylonema pulchrum TaxID=637853 RepID=A0A183E2S2_9BILA|nr:unnamed protein product [Gongylonema pulchrum]